MSGHNLWLQTYTKQIEIVQKQLQEHALKNTFRGIIDIDTISKLFNGACQEITKLQNKVNQLEIELDRKKNFSFFDK